MTKVDYPHLFINEPPNSFAYINPAGGGSDYFATPDRVDKVAHASKIQNQLRKVRESALNESSERTSVSLPARAGTYTEFKSALGFELKFESLEARRSGVRLLSVRVESDPDSGEETQYCTVYIPFGKEHVLMNKVEKYIEDIRTKEHENPKNKSLIESIESLRTAVVHSFWYDPTEHLPSKHSKTWCEVWLRVQSEDVVSIVSKFMDICSILNIETQSSRVSFPEREVVLIYASIEDLDHILRSSDHVAEFRKAKSVSDFFVNQSNYLQSKWVAGLSERVKVNTQASCCACVLDTGVNNEHPLLAKILADESCLTIDTDWTTADFDGHGTLMCGTVAFGENLGSMLQSSSEYELPFHLESCKLIPKSGYVSDKSLYGYSTSHAISRAELKDPSKNRVFCLSSTALEDTDAGRPSSWSGAIDQLAAGVGTDPKRLILLAAGNVGDPDDWCSYPEANLAKSVQDPAQAWNAVTVGAFTFKDEIENISLKSQYTPVARSGQLSPYSTTSRTWNRSWPNKPDIVCEGGNVGVDEFGFTSEIDDLSLLSLSHQPQETLLAPHRMTSGATGIATELACRVMAQYPEAWPETIRALLIHSAKWTEELKRQFTLDGESAKKTRANLLRICGYGIPDPNRAIQSASNNVTLIAQNEIQPFKFHKNSDVRANQMQIYELPWPKDTLALLPDETEVTVNVTLSYFIEPGPGEIGWRNKYRYRSYGLDFDTNAPTEKLENFIARTNKVYRDSNITKQSSLGVNWSVGRQVSRSRGSIHRDWVTLPASEAREVNYIGVFPRSGWWKERHYLGFAEALARYSLVISLSVPTLDIDIYTPVTVKISPKIG